MQTAPLLVRPSTPADLGTVRGIQTRAVSQCEGTFELEAPDVAEVTRRRSVAPDGAT